ncbi:Protein of unknown function [Pyronema omphalodes CBS 100304]|uniref:Uncharacterized protein n=1 Tax=Pyronema omphalodes (strain CBS 100304) TaxID=1076935 RepID=U4LUG6_PYROM|nr:Protein of unknown function [Pyronema omphalodes CBS 100304]
MSTAIEMEDLTPGQPPRNSFDIMIDLAAASNTSIPSHDPPEYTEREGQGQGAKKDKFFWTAVASVPIVVVCSVIIVYVVMNTPRPVKI